MRRASLPLGILVIGGFVATWHLGSLGPGNPYYAAATRSMSTDWRHFFFASFDPGGFLSVDKPPFGLWLQALSARLLGYAPWSVALPDVIAGTLAPVLLWSLICRRLGQVAGTVAALALILTPISVAVERDTVFESILTLLLLGAVGTAIRAITTGRWRWTLATAILLGLAFNTKFWAGLLVLPALTLAFAAQREKSLAARQLIVGALALAAVSVSWVAVVDHTPAAQRPFVGGSATNREADLVTHYDGLARLGWFGATRAPGEGSITQPTTGPDGGPGPLRLVSPELAAQAGWLLPPALAGAAWLVRSRRRWDAEQRTLALILGGWGLTGYAVFSLEGGTFHAYYLAELAPPLAAWAGVAAGALWTRLSRGGAGVWRLPMVVAVTAAWEAWILTSAPSGFLWLLPGLGLAPLLAMATGWSRRARPLARAMPAIAASATALLLALPPAAWVGSTLAASSDGLTPYAGPRSSAPTGAAQADPTRLGLAAFLVAHQDGWRFVAATATARTAAPLIILSGAPVMAMGGFAGADPVLANEPLSDILRRRQVRFFLLSASGAESRFARSIELDVRGSCPAQRPGAPALGGLVPALPPGEALYLCSA
ncbi:MAG TPA: glycosyltransferase family 39 protein [Candidatus Dormibacteraeota bacterium]|jgi:4-amino-4-deoxy-L-arabinose transferase-like glycosyltransferase|nr:glycosyltransferase family 39 protein [Candidatus Dormibacteraeota bacterium]